MGGLFLSMNKIRTNPLIPPIGGGWARAGLFTLFAILMATVAQAQTAGGSGAQVPGDRNSEPRTRTWSIYAEGGLSWATDVWYPNLDAKRSYKQSPAVGGGVDFTIRPWVRVGAEYLWSRYRREQRFSTLDTRSVPVKAYGNYLMNYHNAKLGVGFNVMELWPDRQARWLNIWAGTGVGYTLARGNEYGIYFSTTQTQDGTTVAIGDKAAVNNSSAVTITGNVRTENRHEKFGKPYIPASLHVEADVSRQFTVGVKGEMDWLLNRKEIAPKNLVLALATIRYHFVPGKAKAMKRYHDEQAAALNDRMNALQRESEAERARADKAVADRERMRRENTDLQRRLDDCEKSRPTAAAMVEQPSHVVQFDHNSSYLSREESDRLKAFARGVKGRKLSLLAEASTPGTKDYNQALSERRLQRVIDALVKEGLARGDLKPALAVGSQNGIPTAEGRRVTITAE